MMSSIKGKDGLQLLEPNIITLQIVPEKHAAEVHSCLDFIVIFKLPLNPEEGSLGSLSFTPLTLYH